VSQLPPELLRKGRFDEIFFCALPSEKEREQIFAIHLEKRNYKAKGFDCKRFAKETPNFSGAEIEQVVKSAVLGSYISKKKKLGNEHLIESIQTTVPLYDTCKQDIDWLLTWVGWDPKRKEGLRARFASPASKDNHADPNCVAETENGKKVVMKMKTKKDKDKD
jgi:SpoVK/Ycf46/Vps4 family AAA+-type ATPase